MLSRIERDRIQQQLATVLAGQPSPQSLLTVIFLGHADSILLQLPSGATAPVIASFAINACLESRWTFDPSLLQMLLEHLVGARGVGAFDDILTRVKQGIDPNRIDTDQRMYDAAWLIGQHPFFDRKVFRKRARHLIEENGRPILRVSGGAESFGRTYSRRFLEHLEECLPDTVHVLSVELSVGTGPSYQVRDLLSAVDSQLVAKGKIPPRTGSSYPASAAMWMLKQMMKRPGRWLVVLDGFGQNELNPEVRETIEELAVLVPTGQYRRRIRLVLLDYPQPLPRRSKGDAFDDELPLAASVVQADLMPCLEAWDVEREQQRKKRLGAGQLAKLADGMLGQVPLTGRERLEKLNRWLCDLHDLDLR